MRVQPGRDNSRKTQRHWAIPGYIETRDRDREEEESNSISKPALDKEYTKQVKVRVCASIKACTVMQSSST